MAEKSYHIKDASLVWEPADEGIKRKIMGYQPHLMLVKVHFETGAIGYKHQHPHEQVTYVLSGKFEVEIDGKKEVLEAGDAFVIPSNVEHCAVCLEEGIMIDTFSPLREDFLNQK